MSVFGGVWKVWLRMHPNAELSWHHCLGISLESRPLLEWWRVAVHTRTENIYDISKGAQQWPQKSEKREKEAEENEEALRAQQLFELAACNTTSFSRVKPPSGGYYYWGISRSFSEPTIIFI